MVSNIYSIEIQNDNFFCIKLKKSYETLLFEEKVYKSIKGLLHDIKKENAKVYAGFIPHYLKTATIPIENDIPFDFDEWEFHFNSTEKKIKKYYTKIKDYYLAVELSFDEIKRIHTILNPIKKHVLHIYPITFTMVNLIKRIVKNDTYTLIHTTETSSTLAVIKNDVPQLFKILENHNVESFLNDLPQELKNPTFYIGNNNQESVIIPEYNGYSPSAQFVSAFSLILKEVE